MSSLDDTIQSMPPVFGGDASAALTVLRQRLAQQARSLNDLLDCSEILSAILTATHVAIVLIDMRTGRLTDFSGNLQKMYGLEKAQLESLTVKRLFDGPAPFHFKAFRPRLRQLTESQSLHFEWQALHSRGHAFWIEVRLIEADIKQTSTVVALLRDIDRTKQIEMELRASEARYRTVFENTGTGTFVNEADMTLSMVNGGFENLTGYRKDEIEGRMKWTQIIHPDDHARLKRYHTERRRHGDAPREFECRMIDRSGAVKDMFLKVDLIPGTQRSIGSFIDIGRLKQAEAAVAEKSARLGAILDAFDGFIYVSSSDFRVTYLNEHYKDFLGRDVTGQHCYKALHGRESICPFCVFDQVRQGQTVRFDLRNPTDGRWYHSMNAPIRHSDGAISLLALVNDINDRKEAENTLKLSERSLRRENTLLRASSKERFKFGDIIGKSGPMQRVYELIFNAAATDANVIIQGESGTGKELVARAIHDISDRRDRPFVTVNCGAIPEKLLESEFFGYRQGAFTGAVKDKPGYLDRADGGSLFLDELGEIDPALQVKLLRAIEGHGYMPVGGHEEKHADFRIIAATNRDLKAMVAAGRMREDFFYRVNVIPIQLPPLRERKSDIPLLIFHFLNRHGKEDQLPPITANIYEMLNNYEWPGNVRELENVIQRYISTNQLGIDTPGAAAGRQSRFNPPTPIATAEGADLKSMVAALEQQIIAEYLERHRWNKSKVAKLLKVDRKTLLKKIHQFGLTDPLAGGENDPTVWNSSSE